MSVLTCAQIMQYYCNNQKGTWSSMNLSLMKCAYIVQWYKRKLEFNDCSPQGNQTPSCHVRQDHFRKPTSLLLGLFWAAPEFIGWGADRRAVSRNIDRNCIKNIENMIRTNIGHDTRNIKDGQEI